MNDERSGQTELERRQALKVAELQALALQPLIELIAESLVKRDAFAAVLIAWLETPEGYAAVRGVLPELIAALNAVASTNRYDGRTIARADLPTDMTDDNQELQARREELRKKLFKPVALSYKDKELLAELVRGAEVCFANAEQLFQEASLLREHKHFSRSLFLYQIAMEECAKVDMVGAAATGLTLGHPVDLERLAKAFRDHKAKNFSNAYMSKAPEAEAAARAANDSKAASAAFGASQREIHGFLNSAKNAAMYVDFQDGKFVSPDERIDEQGALAVAALSYYFMSVTCPRLKPLRRMLDEPKMHSEIMAGLGEVILNGLADKATMEGMDAAISSYLKEMAASMVAREKNPPKGE